MSHINLLPWRDAEKQKKKKDFIIFLAMSCVVALGMAYTGKIYIDSMIQDQLQRNTFLQTQTAILDERIAEVHEIKKEKEELVRRINLIQQLETERNTATRLFNTLPEVTPSGVYANAISFKDGRIDVQGFTESNGRVSRMVRNVEASSWLSDAALPSIVTGPSQPITLYRFSMNFMALSEAGINE